MLGFAHGRNVQIDWGLLVSDRIQPLRPPSAAYILTRSIVAAIEHYDAGGRQADRSDLYLEINALCESALKYQDKTIDHFRDLALDLAHCSPQAPFILRKK